MRLWKSRKTRHQSRRRSGNVSRRTRHTAGLATGFEQLEDRQLLTLVVDAVAHDLGPAVPSVEVALDAGVLVPLPAAPST